MSKDRRVAPESAAARLCEWRGMNWQPNGTRLQRRRLHAYEQRQARSAGKRGSAALRMARDELSDIPFFLCIISNEKSSSQNKQNKYRQDIPDIHDRPSYHF